MKRDFTYGFSGIFFCVVVSAICHTVFTTCDVWAAAPAAGPQSGQSAADTLIATYRNLPAYEAKVIFTVETEKGRTRQTQTTDYKIFFDRASQKLIVDRPDYQLAIDQNKLFLIMENVSTHHVEQAISASWHYENVNASLPILDSPPMPDLILLTGDRPWQILTGTTQPPITLEGKSDETSASNSHDNDNQTITRLHITDRSKKQQWTLTLHPLTGLIDEAVATSQSPAVVDPKDPKNKSAVQKTTLRYQFQVQPVSAASSQPSDNLQFTPMDYSHSRALGSLTELIAAQRQNRASSSSAGKASPDSTTTNVSSTPANSKASSKSASAGDASPAPPINLPCLDGTFYSSAKEKTHLVIYDFWATWCGPCKQSLPMLEKLQAWAKQNNKPLKIYAINLEEERSTLKNFVKKTSLSLPVLLDEKGVVGNAYRVQAIPCTVFVIDGKIVKVHTGFSSDPEFLKNEVNQILASYPPPMEEPKP